MITESTHMAKLIILFLIVATQILLLTAFVHGEDFAKTIHRKQFNLHKEKLTHFRVYWHEVASGPNPSFALIRSPLSNSSLFGMVNIIDDPLTTEASIHSAVVGQAQGMYAGAAQKEVGLLMVMNFAFTSGKYNGSTISILGRNAVSSTVREMPVIGGSGMFRFARGYVEARTKMFNPKTGDSSVEYSCYVLHY